MNSSGYTLLLVVIVAEALIGGVNALKCYKCDSRQHSDVCGQDFKLTSLNTTYITDGCDSCLRTEIKNINVFIRNCTLRTKTSFSFKLGCEKGMEDGHVTETCACNKDLCNGARTELTAFSMIIFTLFIVYVLSSA